MRVEISIPQFVILDEIKNKKINQISIAVTYAHLIKADIAKEQVIDWNKINKAIVQRWSLSGLNRVKTVAHQLNDYWSGILPEKKAEKLLKLLDNSSKIKL